jgi:hypothetical protein
LEILTNIKRQNKHVHFHDKIDTFSPGGASGSSSVMSGMTTSNIIPPVTERQQEVNLGLTLVAISVLFIVCQSVKLIPGFN